MKEPKFKIGDLVKTNGSIQAQGEIEAIVEGGDKLGFPWKDDTPHYQITDTRTGVLVFVHERNVEKLNQSDQKV